MGKRPEDLPLDPPLRHDPAADLSDVRLTDWYRFVEEIDSLIATGDYDWATETLEGIRGTVEQHRVVTAGQRRAVGNIEAAKREPRREGFRRRYEGWGR